MFLVAALRCRWQCWPVCFQQQCLLHLSLFYLGLAGLEVSQKTKNNQSLPTQPRDFFLFSCLFYLVFSLLFSSLSAQQLESWKLRLLLPAAVFWLASPHYPVVKSRPWSQPAQICVWQSWLHETTRIWLHFDSGSLDENFVSAVCQRVTTATLCFTGA